MVVATFGPTTGWAGRTITREGETFILQDYGPITARDVITYDQQRHLVWVSEDMRAWVVSLVSAAPTAALAQPQGTPGIGVAGFICVLAGLIVPGAGIVGLVLSIIGYRQAKREDRPSGLPFAGMIIGIVAIVVGIALAAAIPMYLTQREKAKDSAVREGVHSIEIALQSYALEHGDRYPDPSVVSQSELEPYVISWPTNPYTGLPMVPGTGEGDFAYTAAADGSSFTLQGFGSGGSVVISVP